MDREHVQHIIIHHSYTQKGNVETFKRFHIGDKGWSDIGVHYVICNGNGGKDGEIQNGRPLEVAGAHSRGMNTKSIGILLIGDFDHYFPSKNQWASLVDLVKTLMGEFNVPADNVIGHREVYGILGQESKKSCPGWKFDMDKLRRDVSGMSGGEFFADGRLRADDIDIVVEGKPISADVRIVGGRPMIAIKDLSLIIPQLNSRWGGSSRMIEIEFKKEEEVTKA